jgi:hypothetical protein
MSRKNEWFEAFSVLGVLALIGGGIYCLVGLSSKCKKCDKWFSSYPYRHEIIKTEQAAKDI